MATNAPLAAGRLIRDDAGAGRGRRRLAAAENSRQLTTYHVARLEKFGIEYQLQNKRGYVECGDLSPLSLSSPSEFR